MDKMKGVLAQKTLIVRQERALKQKLKQVPPLPLFSAPLSPPSQTPRLLLSFLTMSAH